MTSEDTKSQRGGTALACRLILSSFAALFGVSMLLIAPGAEKPAAHYQLSYLEKVLMPRPSWADKLGLKLL